MKENFNEERESALLTFVQSNFGLEVFTPGLERTAPLYLPFKEWALKNKIKVTIIAGTNGKGQTAHTLAHFLKASGKSVALWTSPHILSLRERFHANGLDITYDELELVLKEARGHIKKNYGFAVSFYEFLFFAFLLWVKKGGVVDHLILEVGLGGRLDAVNHFDADCSSITSISRDHQVILGNRYDLILNEKIAVSRRGRPLFTQFRLNYLNEQTRKYCEENGILWKPLPLPPVSDYFLENQLMAGALFSWLEPELELPSEEIPSFKGRREEMTFRQNHLIFIGAHNIDGVRKMIEIFHGQNAETPSKVLMSFSKRPEEEVKIMVKSVVEFFGQNVEVTLTSFDHPKALESGVICEVQKEIHKISKGLLNFVTDWKSELIFSKNQNILVCGSYYFVGEVQRFILQS